MLDLLYRNYVRKWSLIDGYPQCIEDAVKATATVAVPAIQVGLAIDSANDLVLAYEAALRVPAPDGEASDDDYEAAQAVISSASATTIALALWRTPVPEAETVERAAWEAAKATVQAAIAAAAQIPLAEDPRPLPISVSLRQFTQAAAMLALISNDEALSWVKREALPAIMEDMLAAIPEQYRWEARMLLLGALSFEPGNNYVTILSIVKSISDDLLGQLWRLAGAL
jgi:hypothetical protein